ncbi:hypothetical protein AWZ03_002163 [Drosophila navojoa]|uniref:Uncharacterized protein n=1 Tax=Drosophila navojoa TaxID=7232 RepID=A0A484BRG3_DRONA|nr:hypothetical protein AWZ03_002163 [Drosophila navojoa]
MKLNPEAALRQNPNPFALLARSANGLISPCPKIKLQKYFNILWQHAGTSPTSTTHIQSQQQQQQQQQQRQHRTDAVRPIGKWVWQPQLDLH